MGTFWWQYRHTRGGEEPRPISGVCIKTSPLTAPCFTLHITKKKREKPISIRFVGDVAAAENYAASPLSLPPASTDFVLSLQGFNNVLIRGAVPSSFFLEMNEWMNLIEGSQVQCSAGGCSRMAVEEKKKKKLYTCTSTCTAPASKLQCIHALHYTLDKIQLCCR